MSPFLCFRSVRVQHLCKTGFSLKQVSCQLLRWERLQEEENDPTRILSHPTPTLHRTFHTSDVQRQGTDGV